MERLGHYDAFVARLQSVCEDRDLPLRVLGLAADYPIYSIDLNNQAKETIGICAGIHGDETAGPWALLKFLETYDLPKSYNFIIFPLANPFGFDHGRRYNYQNRDLNRHFRDKVLEGENKLLYNAVKKKNLCLFYSLHEHPLAHGFYLYSHGVPEWMGEEMLRLARKHRFPIKTFWGNKRIDGEIRLTTLAGDNSFEDRLYLDGVPYVVPETPGKVSLGRRIILNYELLKMTMDHFQPEERRKAA